MACILLIDDHEPVRLSLDFYLSGLGHAVLCAQDGIHGLELASERPIDVILLDVDMPRMNGFSVCAVLQSDPKLRRVPVVMMTGRATQDVHDRAMAAGAKALLRKPFDLELLQTTLSGCLGGAVAPKPDS